MKNFCLLVVILLSPILYFSQETIPLDKLTLRHIKGMNSIDLLGGFGNFNKEDTISSFTLGVYFSRYLKNDLILSVGASYENGKINLTNFTSSGLCAIVYYTLGDAEERVFLNAGVGVHSSLENYKNTYLKINEDKVASGPFASALVEIFPINRLAILARFDQIYTIGSKLGNWHYNLQGGLRFIL